MRYSFYVIVEVPKFNTSVFSNAIKFGESKTRLRVLYLDQTSHLLLFGHYVLIGLIGCCIYPS